MMGDRSKNSSIEVSRRSVLLQGRSSAPQRMSIRTLPPSVQPNCCRAC